MCFAPRDCHAATLPRLPFRGLGGATDGAVDGTRIAGSLPRALVAEGPRNCDACPEKARFGRKVFHPNVCRLYDIVEWNDSHSIWISFRSGAGPAAHRSPA